MKLTDAQAFIFDMDGTMIDNMAFHTQSWCEFLASIGVEVAAEQFHRATAGKHNADILRLYLGQQLSEAEISAYAAQKEHLYRHSYRPHLRPLAGLYEWLAQARQRQIKLAVATSAGRDNIQFVFDALELDPYFDVVVSGEEVPQGKPHPDIFLHTASKLHVSPAACVVFEDSLAGIEAAQRAGMRVVTLTTSLQAHEVTSRAEVLYAVPDFTTLSLDDKS